MEIKRWDKIIYDNTEINKTFNKIEYNQNIHNTMKSKKASKVFSCKQIFLWNRNMQESMFISKDPNSMFSFE